MKLTESQKYTLGLIRQNLGSSKAGLIHKGSANALIKRNLIKMGKNGIDYELTKLGLNYFSK